jgi:[ribosomal protein S5]-alanine N-acetyltransferase
LILRTERLHLRPLTVQDAPALFAARGDPEAMRWWDWPAQKTVADIETLIAEHDALIQDGSVLWWAVALSPDGPAIGECDLSEIDRHHRRAEPGFMLARAYWGRGYATEAMRAVIGYGFGVLGLERLIARIHSSNDASRRVLEKLGFVCEGRLRGHVLRDGERRDCLVYGRLRDGAASIASAMSA